MINRSEFVLTVCGVLIGLLLMEGVARIFAPKDSVFGDHAMMRPYSGGEFDPRTTADTMHENSDPNRRQKYVPDANRWYRLDPEPEIPATGRLVLNFGDSSTWGWGLTNLDDAYGTVLNELLPPDVTSVNLGVPSYSSLEGRRYAEEFIPKYADRLVGVTLYFGNNDAIENGKTDNEELHERANTSAAAALLAKYSALYRLAASIGPRIAATRAHSAPRVSPEDYEANLRAIVDLCRSYGIPVVIIEPSVPLSWTPAHLTRFIDLGPELRNPWAIDELAIANRYFRVGIELVRQRDDAYEPLLREAVEHDWTVPRIKRAWMERLHAFDHAPGVTVVRLPEVFILAEFPYAFEDYCHPSAIRHREIAERIAAVL